MTPDEQEFMRYGFCPETVRVLGHEGMDGEVLRSVQKVESDAKVRAAVSVAWSILKDCTEEQRCEFLDKLSEEFYLECFSDTCLGYCRRGCDE